MASQVFRLFVFVLLAVVSFSDGMVKMLVNVARPGIAENGSTSVNFHQMITQAQLPTTIILCEGTMYEIVCGRGEVIYIESAFYGREERHHCKVGVYLGPKCNQPTALKTIFNLCHGKATCAIDVSADLFGVRCRRVSKYAEIRYHCAQPDHNVTGNCFSKRWSNWINANSPDDVGDDETVDTHAKLGMLPCINYNGVQIQPTKADRSTATSQVLKTGSKFGALCLNSDQIDHKCKDYKVRYCCPGGVSIPNALNKSAPQKYRCKRPDDIENGRITPADKPRFKPGEIIKFECNIYEWKFMGSVKAVCLPNGKWNKQPPSCTKLTIGTQHTTTTTLCQDAYQQLTCGDEKVIYLQHVFYGRKDQFVCNKEPERTYKKCQHKDALKVVYAHCHGKTTCLLQASAEWFGNVCPGTLKYLQIRYHCDYPGSNIVGNCYSSRWSDWINLGTPTPLGDMETLRSHKKRTKIPCSNPNGLQIGLTTNDTASMTHQVLRSGLNYGVACFNKDQINNEPCLDYKIRYCCEDTSVIGIQ